MPLTGYLKLGDIKGESRDAFVFKSVKDVEPETDPVDDFMIKGGDEGLKGLLLPAVQAARDASASTAEPLHSEELTLNYTEVEWTY